MRIMEESTLDSENRISTLRKALLIVSEENSKLPDTCTDIDDSDTLVSLGTKGKWDAVSHLLRVATEMLEQRRRFPSIEINENIPRHACEGGKEPSSFPVSTEDGEENTNKQPTILLLIPEIIASVSYNGRTILQLAVVAHRVDVVTMILDYCDRVFSYSTNCVVSTLSPVALRLICHTDYDGNTALHLACTVQAIGVLDVLLKRCDSDTICRGRRSDGWPPILVASHQLWWDGVKLLLRRGARADIVGSYTPYATGENDTSENFRFRQGWTPLLFFAAASPQAYRSTILLRLLSQRDLNIDICVAAPHNNKTVLHWVCQHGDLPVARKILDDPWGISLLGIHSSHGTPLQIACWYGHSNLVSYILQVQESITAMENTYEGDRGCVNTLAVNSRVNALHIACAMGHTRLANMLMNNAANLETKAQSLSRNIQSNLREIGENLGIPLFCACDGGHFETVKMLLKDWNARVGISQRPFLCNRDVDHQDHSYSATSGKHHLSSAYVALEHIRSSADLEVMGILLDRSGPEIFVEPNGANGSTLLHRLCFLACEHRFRRRSFVTAESHHRNSTSSVVPNLVHWFLDPQQHWANKVQLRTKNRFGWTPLHIACAYCNIDVVMTLLARCGIDGRNDATNAGSTPLHLACQLGRRNIVVALLEDGARTALENRNGKTPLDAALSSSCRRLDVSTVFLLIRGMVGEGVLTGISGPLLQHVADV